MIDIAIIKPGHALLWNWPKSQGSIVVVKNVTPDGRVEAILGKDRQGVVYPSSLAYVPGVEYAPAEPIKKPRKPRTKAASVDRGAVPVASH